MPVILLDGRLASPATTWGASVQWRAFCDLLSKSGLHGFAPTMTAICKPPVSMGAMDAQVVEGNDGTIGRGPSKTASHVTWARLVMEQPAAWGPWDWPLVTFLRPWKLYSTTSSRHPSFKQILKWKSTQLGAKCYMYRECWCERNGICNRHLCCLFFGISRFIEVLTPWMEVCQGLGPSDHQLLWLHLGPGGNDDRRSYSVSDDACKHSSYNFFVCFFFPKKPQMTSSGFKLTELN